MQSTFAGDIEVTVLRSGREVARVTRPLRQTAEGPVVKFKRQLWLVTGSTIDLDTAPINDDAKEQPEEIVVPLEETYASQDDVISADVDRRVIVDAGPGTGKTYVACNRVAHLIREGVSPGRIWIISFTRTAVHEIRNRLAGSLDDPSEAAGVRIATLDSHAWAIQSGFSKDAALTGSHDDNIAATLAQIKGDEDVQEYLGRVSHLIVDEAQDIVGIRAQLVLALINGVREECGITIFADRAQAIYGFTENETKKSGDISLLEQLEGMGFKGEDLIDVHRTSEPGLLRIFTEVRRAVLDESTPTTARGAAVREQIRQFAGIDAGPAKDFKLAEVKPGALVLMRQRADVLVTSSYGQDTQHRLRMSGLPSRIMPWIGELLWDHTDRRLTRDEFDERWSSNVRTMSANAADGAWALLVEAAGDSDKVIDIQRLRNILGRSNPPSLFTSPDYGDGGPIIGTIHASKGREADDVHLFLPPEDYDGSEDENEEIRVMFVGATRARNRLAVGSTGPRRSSDHNGRVWKRLPKGRIQVEVGRMYDLDAAGLVGNMAFATAASAQNAQHRIRSSPVATGLFASAQKDLHWRMELVDAAKQRLCVLSERLKSDLRDIAGRCDEKRPPMFLQYVRSMGLRTIGLRVDDPSLPYLHEPWSSSGFVIAPMLTGFCMSKF
ncbi:UvrD-helicase domain-containing protein [Kaistia granuli]|uniref:UvrD-helicase domain-containing protein n=1 Tax=Kaistia granuli TaxID=363259 RepID=UPI000379D011|nr:UvrD-helicase domain-containing protein [Kaistia granuli]